MTLTSFQTDLLTALIRRGISGNRSPHAYPHEKSEIGRDNIYLTKADGEVLVGMGLLEYTSSGTLHWSLTSLGIRTALKLLPKGTYKPLSLKSLLKKAFELLYFTEKDASGEPAIPYIWVPGKSKVVLVLGENAGGKSFFRKIIQEMTRAGRPARAFEPERKAGLFPVRECIALSMYGRTSGGIESSFIYGPEGWLSTGHNSSRTVTQAILTAEDRAHTTIIYWDEPDIGMSMGAAAGAGLDMAEYLGKTSPLIQAVFITTHSREMVAPLAALNPHYIYLGDSKGPATLQEWLVHQPRPLRPSELDAIGSTRHARIQGILNRLKS